MALSESFTGTPSIPVSGNGATSQVAGSPKSEFHVNGAFTNGFIALQVQNPVDSSWSAVKGALIDSAMGGAQLIIETPDSNLTYRFTYKDIVGIVNAYFGP